MESSNPRTEFVNINMESISDNNLQSSAQTSDLVTNTSNELMQQFSKILSRSDTHLNEQIGNLPKIFIEKRPSMLGSKGIMMRDESYFIKNSDDKIIGGFSLIIFLSSKRPRTAYLNGITINEAMRGKGLGKATYLEIIKMLKKDGIKLTSGFQLSRGSKPIWDWLVEKGFARKVKESAIDETTENAAFSDEEYEVL